MALVVYSFGTVQFTVIGGAAPQKIDISFGMKWAEVPRIGTTPAMQFVGVESPQYTFTGDIFSDIGNGANELRAMLNICASDQPLMRGGEYLGNFALTALNLSAPLLNIDGTPKKLIFTATLKQVTP